MTTRILVDATHAEETRIVVVDGKRLVDFDFETTTKKHLKGNIYLAKVTRVEPSLQAAFVDYGGNRHGFLSFTEIHPDYYQIPVADREALLLDEAEEAARQAKLEDEVENNNVEVKDSFEKSNGEISLSIDVELNDDAGPPEESEEAGAIDVLDEVPRPRGRSRRSYKIQEVIKRRQILLIQVVKEERGNKGAALTTYLSLAGRYCVLMPNTARGGGISRKISNPAARRKLKGIVSDLDVPEGMGVIVRTAGQNRNKSELRRDFEYLLRLWDSVRDLTLDSTAPTVVYEEADLIKRAIRDLYAKEIDEILVDGEEGYRVAKDFMRMLMPSHAKKVQPYRSRIPLLHSYQIEEQLDSMHSNVVQLKSGGYLVLAQTEALVAIDVNSGRSTKERNIEETALKTNLEASDEIGRQLRLRDLAGLVVVDFIDMDENRNNRAVERRMKQALKDDRARIQIGRISSFGLMELSRQRLRPSLFEASTRVCEICSGTGFVRTTESTSLHILRNIEEEGIRGRAIELTVHAPTEVALYMLNQKRDHLSAIQNRYEMQVYVLGDETLVAPECRLTVEQARSPKEIEAIEAEQQNSATVPDLSDDDKNVFSDVKDQENKGNNSDRRPRRRRRPRNKMETKKKETSTASLENTDSEISTPVDEEQSKKATSEISGTSAEDNGRRRRRGRRGGRKRKVTGEPTNQTASQSEELVHGKSDINNKNSRKTEPNSTSLIAKETSHVSIPEAQEHPRKSEVMDPPIISAEPDLNLSPNLDSNAEGLSGSKPIKPENKSKKQPSKPLQSQNKNERMNEFEGVIDTDTNGSSSEVKNKNQSGQPKRKGWWQKGGLF